jgi:hypothetical protein
MTAAPLPHRLTIPLRPGEAVRHWLVSAVSEARYDVPDQPMQGRMDALFFVASHKNFIPHEYPCRTAFAAEHRARRPEPLATAEPARVWLPFGSDRVDLSGFWFRPTRLAAAARTLIRAEAAGRARLRLTTCGGGILSVGGREAGWVAGYVRNMEAAAEFEVDLVAGENEIAVVIDDLAERDARFFFQLDYLDGPPASLALPITVEAPLAASLERLLADMAFDRPSYTQGDVVIELPEPAPADLAAHVEIVGDFISHERVERTAAIPRGATRFTVDAAERLPADFRHFKLTLSAGGHAVSRVIGTEICHVARQGEPPATLALRIAEALDEVAEHAEPDTVRALARLATGRAGAETDAMIAACLPAIEDCHDCADFLLVPLLWARTRYADGIGAATRARVDAAILGYRYWMDEPGNDVQWYFSENHALLFHTAAYLAGALMPEARFVRSGRPGAEQAAVGHDRVIGWLDHFEEWEMGEWNSVPYFPIDLKGLTALAALAPDPSVRARAAAGIARLLEIVARSSHQGLVTASQGRSYEHSLRPGRSLELSAIARLVFGRGWYGRRVHALPLLALALRDHGVTVPESLAGTAAYAGPDALEWCFAQGENRVARLYHYKTRDFAMGSISGYRWQQWGYQETALHLRLGDLPEAQIWINHPGETIQFGYGRPSYWGGSGTLPRAHQYRALALLDFAAAPGQPDFTHAWLPAAAFDEVRVEGNRILVKAGAAYALILGGTDFVPVTTGPTRDQEVRLPGRLGRWLIRLSDAATEGSLDAFAARFEGLAAVDDGTGAAADIRILDPDYGPVRFGADAVVEAEGRRIDPATFTIAGRTDILPRR